MDFKEGNLKRSGSHGTARAVIICLECGLAEKQRAQKTCGPKGRKGELERELQDFAVTHSEALCDGIYLDPNKHKEQ